MHITIEKTANYTFNIGCLERVDKPYYFEIVPNDTSLTMFRARFYQDLLQYRGNNKLFENLSIQIKELPYVPGYVSMTTSEEEKDDYFMSKFFDTSKDVHFAFVEFLTQLTKIVKNEVLQIDNNIKWLKSVAEELSKNS